MAYDHALGHGLANPKELALPGIALAGLGRCGRWGRGGLRLGLGSRGRSGLHFGLAGASAWSGAGWC